MDAKSMLRFKMIFWLGVGVLAVSFSYIFMCTFLHVPEENRRFADATMGFLSGTVITGFLAYFIGGSADIPKPTPPSTSIKTTEITASTTSSEE